LCACDADALELLRVADAAAQQNLGRPVDAGREHDTVGVDPLLASVGDRDQAAQPGVVQHEPIHHRVAVNRQVRILSDGISAVPEHDVDVDVGNEHLPAAGRRRPPSAGNMVVITGAIADPRSAEKVIRPAVLAPV
jgi:hypothetical protein